MQNGAAALLCSCRLGSGKQGANIVVAKEVSQLTAQKPGARIMRQRTCDASHQAARNVLVDLAPRKLQHGPALEPPAENNAKALGGDVCYLGLPGLLSFVPRRQAQAWEPAGVPNGGPAFHYRPLGASALRAPRGGVERAAPA